MLYSQLVIHKGYWPELWGHWCFCSLACLQKVFWQEFLVCQEYFFFFNIAFFLIKHLFHCCITSSIFQFWNSWFWHFCLFWCFFQEYGSLKLPNPLFGWHHSQVILLFFNNVAIMCLGMALYVFILFGIKKIIYIFGCTRYSLQYVASLILVAACGIFSCNRQTPSYSVWDPDPWTGIEPWPLHWERVVLATGPTGKSQFSLVLIMFLEPALNSFHQVLKTPLLLVVVYLLSRVWLFVTTCTVAIQAPLSMGIPRQEYWIGLPFPSPGDLPDPGMEPASSASPADSLPLSHRGSPLSQYTFKYCFLLIITLSLSPTFHQAIYLAFFLCPHVSHGLY